jgi:predicted ATPase with chaperone activity
VTKYQKRISGPMLDRIDIHIEVPRVDYEKLSSDRLSESSALIRERVQAARERQQARFQGSGIVCNSHMRVAEVRKFCKLDEAGDSLVRAAMSQLNLSARGIIGCLPVPAAPKQASWRARLRIWRGVRIFSPYTWRRRCNIGKS